jgi:dipeptidyl aminopeptidase/acylaminoacyl peptidase
MTNWIVSHTDQFKVAISDRSVSNLISDYGLSDIGFPCNIDIYGTTPWDDLHYLWNNSALKYADKIKAPVLFIHGIADYRCPWDNALQLHNAITYFGGTSKVIGFKDETHELCRSGSPKNRVRRLDEMVKWFKKYL